MNDSDHWERLQELFYLAERTAPGDRERVLSAAGAEDEVRRRVFEILASSEIDMGPTAEPEANRGAVGSSVGQYRLVRLIGSGGIGTVYLAERMAGGILQRSALKVLAPHAAGPSFAERFQREQHILSSLDHPHITRMLDAGVGETGQPYLVMEYVDGVHLDVYCDLHRYTIEQRLRLFLQVCDAVAYAHRNLVVHLDLKPSNTLVTADGNVKLLDFGTSKLIDNNGRFTSTLMATPAYASPEQMRGEPVTTLCDVYSLGAMLFELLAGHRPGASFSVIALLDRAAREQEPEKLEDAATESAAFARGTSASRLRQSLAGDLATIVAKCLRPRAKDRYVSVNALSNDVLRYLEGKPVLAQPQTTTYRVGKFIRRHRTRVVVAAVVTVALSAALGYASWRQRQAYEEGQRALRMQVFLSRLIRLANSGHTGKHDVTLPEFLQLGVKMLPQYIPNPRDLRMAELSLGESMFDDGDMAHAGPVFRQVMESAKRDGDVPAEAEAETFAGAVAYQEGDLAQGKLLTQQALELSRHKGVSVSVRVLSEIHFAANQENNGFQSDDNIRLLEDAVKQSRASDIPEEEKAFALTTLADDRMLRGQIPQALPSLNEALAIYSKDPFSLCQQSFLYGEMGYAQQRRENFPEALAMHQKAYQGFVACSGADTQDALTQRDYVAGALIDLHRAPEAIALLEPNLIAWRKAVGSTPPLAEPLYFLALAYDQTGQWDKAAAMSKEEVDVQTGKIAENDRRFGVGHWTWAQALAGAHRYADALPHAMIADSLLNKGAVSPGAKRMAAEAHTLRLELEARVAQK